MPQMSADDSQVFFEMAHKSLVHHALKHMGDSERFILFDGLSTIATGLEILSTELKATRNEIAELKTLLQQAPRRTPRAPCSGDDGDLLALDQLEIDGGTQARPTGHVDQPVAADHDILLQAVLLRRIGQQDLEELGVPERGDDVQVGYVVQRVAAMMDLVVHAE